MNRRSHFLALTWAAAALAGPGTAQQQPADTLAAASSDTLPVVPLDPVRVTVLRTPLALVQVPFAVTVETGTGSGAGLSLAEAIGLVPGVQVDARYAFSEGDRISIRGFGARAQFGVRGVKVLVDGIPATLPDGQSALSHVDPWRIHRAEVFRGPASALWGNAAGGVLQLETSPSRPGVRVATLTGSHGLRRLAGDAGWVSGDRPGAFRLGLSTTLFSWDGHREHAAADKRFATARAAWRGVRDEIVVVAHGVAYDALSAGSLSADQLAEDRFQANPFNVVQATGEEATQAQVGVTWQRQRFRLAAWALGRSLDNPIPPAIIELDRWASGIRLTLGSGEGPVPHPRSPDWTVGVDAEVQSDARANYENDGGRQGALTLDQTERVAVVAPFVEVGLPLPGPFHLRGGLRWDLYRFTADDRLVAAGDGDDSGSRQMGHLSPTVGIVADLGAATVFGNIATSFQTPTTTELVNRPTGQGGFNPDLEPQRAVSFEVGARARAGHGPGPQAALQVAAYRTRINDALIPFEVASAPGRSFFRNAGSAVHRGVEVDAWVAPTPESRALRGLTFRVGYAWIDARFHEYDTGSADHSGNRVPGIAPHRWTGSLVWAPEAGGRAELEYRRVARVPVDDANTADAPAYSLITARAASPPLALMGTSVAAFFEAHNLFDQDHVSSVVVNAFGGRYYEPGPGRSLAIGVRIGGAP